MSIVNNRVLWIGVALAAIFLLLDLSMEGSDMVKMLNAIFIGSVVSMLIVFFPIIRSIVLGVEQYTKAKHFALGVICWGASLMVSRSNSSLWQATGKQQWILETPVVSISVFLAILGSTLMCTSSLVPEETAVPRPQDDVAKAILWGTLATLAVAAFQHSGFKLDFLWGPWYYG